MSPTKVPETKKPTSKLAGESAAASPKDPFILQWRSLGIGIVIGLLLFLVLRAIGVHPTEVDILGIKFTIPSSVSTSTPNGPDVLPLDSLPFWAFSYGFGNDFITPQHFSYLTIVNDIRSEKTYKLNYAMPAQGDAAAGISFTLAEPIDLSHYTYIEALVKFTNSQCDLFIKDTSLGAGPFVTLSDTVANSLQSPLVEGKWRFKIPLSYFGSINLRTVKEIGCNAQRCQDNCIIEIGKIQFGKQ